MPRFAANLTTLFTELPLLERFAAAARAGFEAVEIQFPYAFEAARFADALAASGLTLVLHNLPPGDWDGGERGIACLPDRTAEFRAGVDRAIAYATAVGCQRLNCLAGRRPPHRTAAECRRTLIDNLRHAAELTAGAGIELVLEPVNSRDVPDFFIDRPRMGFDLLDEVGADNLKLQFDVYHAQVMEGDLLRSIERELGRIGHIQIADNPGRNEPGSGEINYPFLFSRFDQIGYAGWIGCEYKPLTDTAAGLGWFASYRVKRGTLP